MTHKLTGLSRRYQAALREHLQQRSQAGLQPARELGYRAMHLGLETLDLARVHEKALIALVLPGCLPRTRDARLRRAGAFFAEAITPIEKTHRTAREANVHLNHLIKTLHRRSADLTKSNRQLRHEIIHRKSVEESLRKSGRHYTQLLEHSHYLQEQLRHLSRRLLLAQEEERKKISRELHDQIAQTLTSINVRLATLTSESVLNTKGLQRKIASTQRMVERSVDIVHRFARELRPTVLDDLGLIPALHSFVKGFSKQTRLYVHLTVFPAVEKLDNAKRTVLYRVAQEALTNVARHAHAREVEVSIERVPGGVCMTIKDDGKSFQVDRVLRVKKFKRLGLLGMRERVEMVGGRFGVESAPGKGTTICARIPFSNDHAGVLADAAAARSKL